jgi:hypothetical protein
MYKQVLTRKIIWFYKLKYNFKNLTYNKKIQELLLEEESHWQGPVSLS